MTSKDNPTININKYDLSKKTLKELVQILDEIDESQRFYKEYNPFALNSSPLLFAIEYRIDNVQHEETKDLLRQLKASIEVKYEEKSDAFIENIMKCGFKNDVDKRESILISVKNGIVGRIKSIIDLLNPFN